MGCQFDMDVITPIYYSERDFLNSFGNSLIEQAHKTMIIFRTLIKIIYYRVMLSVSTLLSRRINLTIV